MLRRIFFVGLMGVLVFLGGCSGYKRLKRFFKKVDVHVGVDYLDDGKNGRREVWGIHDLEEKIVGIMRPDDSYADVDTLDFVRTTR
jgi:Uri superfamily endonuclease